VRDAAPRAVAVLVVIALHVLALFLFFLPARLPGFAVNGAVRETVLYLWHAPPPVQQTGRPTAVVPRLSTGKIMRSLPALAPAQPSESQLQGLGADLFACRPEDIGGLSLEQQMRCAHVGLAIAQPPPDLFAPLRSRSRNPQRWATALALHKAPPLAPCFTHQGFSPLATAFCLAEMAIDGYDQDNHDKYYLGQFNSSSESGSR
jgi:hypothetical protein